VKPGLTLPQIRQILTNTTQKIGGPYGPTGRDDRYGFGRVDAAAAVVAASQVVP
jgi:hypothetical protein